MKALKKIGRIVLSIFLALVVIAAAYVAYVLIAYHRLPDNVELEVVRPVKYGPAPSVGQEYKIVSWNIGFGAYEDDFGFFMDGGTQAWAWSKERLTANIMKIGKQLRAQDADFLLVQEIDTKSTRSYKVNELEMLSAALTEYTWDFAQNYDSPFLFYPITQPHGKSVAGIGTFTTFDIASALRRSLPIEKGFSKFLDLDRCYSVSRIPLKDGSELVLYNMHLSAYTSDPTTATEQLRLLLEDMQAEYEAGNHCVAGGDFNKDVLGDSSVWFGEGDKEYSWAQPIPPETFDGVDISLVAPLDEDDPVPSCRNADGPYHEGQYVLTIDGFLVSPNVEVRESGVVDYAFRYSDHNPVYMTFVLK
ncbi:MAG: endonuclease/exonuclease/phosphatase family protein [Oscillospiraceae bacterium]|nr:endonuclease/exonuclease/phosphatase family protein [Oscillospiraceae bacterium]